MRCLLIFILCFGLNEISYSQLLYDGGIMDTTEHYSLRACPPGTTALSCNNPVSFNITASGYVGDNPTAGDGGCNPCCYAGADLDCDGLQDVPFSVENSKWYRYCNSTGAPMTLDMVVDEPGTGSTCNLQGALWIGASLSTTVMDCGNTSYNMFDSNPGGAADGFTFSVTVPNGQCAYIMIDGYAGTTCSGVTVEADCPTLSADFGSFNYSHEANQLRLKWTTLTEMNTDYFMVMKSTDGIYFKPEGNLSAAGNSSTLRNYEFAIDNSEEEGYYYLKLVDYDGSYQISKTIYVSDDSTPAEILYQVNIFGQKVNDTYKGIRIIHYSDGSTQKICSE